MTKTTNDPDVPQRDDEDTERAVDLMEALVKTMVEHDERVSCKAQLAALISVAVKCGAHVHLEHGVTLPSIATAFVMGLTEAVTEQQQADALGDLNAPPFSAN